MTNFFTKAFAKFDIFGSEVGLNYQKDNIFKTTFGGFMTLGFFAFLGIFFWNNILSFLNKESVYSTTNRQFYLDPPTVTLNSKNFMFAVQINQDDFIQSPYLNITFETRDYVTYPNGTKIKKLYPTQLEPCTAAHWSQLPEYGLNWTETFYTYNFKQFLCPQKDYEFQLGGTYISEHFNHWKFSVVKCSNNTMHDALWKPTCKSDEQVEQYFNKTQNIRFKIFTSNFIINGLESKHYVDNFVEDSIFFLVQNKNSYITSDIYLSENIIQTDQSLMPFPSIKNETIINFQSKNFRDQYTFGQIGTVFADFFIRKDPFVLTINRSFQKISQIISYVGGFAQIFILGTAILVNFYNEYIYALSLANKIYDFQFSNDQQKKDKRNQQISQKQFQQQYSDNHQIETQNRLSVFQKIAKKNSNEMKINQKLDDQTEQLDLEKQNIQKQDNPQQVNINLPNKNINKLTIRENEGLLPLDDLKEIIAKRKQLIEHTQQVQQYQKLQNLNKIQRQVKTEKQIDQKQQIEDDNTFQQKQNCNENQLQCQDKIENPRIKTDKLVPTFQIESKIVLNESILPESPLDIQNSGLFQKQITKNDDYQKEMDKIQSQEIKDISHEQTIQITKQAIDIQNLNKEDIISCENIHITSHQGLSLANTPSNYLLKDTPKSKFHSQNNILLHGLGYQSQKQFLQKEFDYLLKKQATLQMTFKYFLYKISCHKFFKTEQVLLLDKANSQMKKDLDIFTIINRIKEIEKFKKLFLDKNQEILFNFFPKPVISVNTEEQNLTRAEIEDQVKESKMKDSQVNIKPHKMNEQQQKKLNVSIKVASIVQKAASKFKKPLISKFNEYNTLNTYNMLYDAYEKLIAEGQNSKFNKKLIELLGDDLSKIFEISTMQNQFFVKNKLINKFILQIKRIAIKGKINQKSNFSQYVNQNKISYQPDIVDQNSKKNILTDQITSFPSIERKLGQTQNYS